VTGRSAWVVDSVFVLAFVAAGAMTILAGGNERAQYTAKELMPRLIVGFIAAHFSSLFVGKAIDLGNGLVSALATGDPDHPAAFDAIKSDVHAGQSNPGIVLLYLVLVVIIIILLAATTLSFLVRFGVLLVLATVAPLALACHALPQTDPIARLWWRSLLGCLAVPVLQALMLQNAQWMLEDPTHTLPAGLPMDAGSAMNLLVVVVLLWSTVKVPGLVRRFAMQGGSRGSVIGTIARVVVVQQVARAVPGLGTAGRGLRAVTR
jgi:hypothetical protein